MPSLISTTAIDPVAHLPDEPLKEYLTTLSYEIRRLVCAHPGQSFDPLKQGWLSLPTTMGRRENVEAGGAVLFEFANR